MKIRGDIALFNRSIILISVLLAVSLLLYNFYDPNTRESCSAVSCSSVAATLEGVRLGLGLTRGQIFSNLI